MKKGSKKSAKSAAFDAVVAKTDDGTVQITYKIPYTKIEKAKEKAIDELGKDISIPGFRKGKAPKDVLAKQIPENTLLEKTLAQILPSLVGKSIEKENLKLVTYPKFQLIKAKEGEDWEVRAHSAEIPEFELGDYKKKIAGELRSKNIWTPNKKGEKRKIPTREEKEQEIIKALLENINVKIPKLLLEQETNLKLSRLLERLEKLGLTLDSYLSSIKKKPQDLRKEYENQAKQTLALDLILNKIFDTESLKVEDSDIEAAINAGSADKGLAKTLKSPEQRRLIEAVLRKRAALNFIVSHA